MAVFEDDTEAKLDRAISELNEISALIEQREKKNPDNTSLTTSPVIRKRKRK